jgi:uncharacterized membrane protein
MGFDLITVIKEEKKMFSFMFVCGFWTPAANMSCLLKFLFKEKCLQKETFNALLVHTVQRMIAKKSFFLEYHKKLHF